MRSYSLDYIMEGKIINITSLAMIEEYQLIPAINIKKLELNKIKTYLGESS